MRTIARTTGRARRLVAAVAATAAVSASAALPAPAAEEALVDRSPYTDTLQMRADDTVQATIAFSRLAFPGGADEVVLGRHDGFADAFASGLLQTQRPLLLTSPDGLDARTAIELRRLRPARVLVLGGESALGDDVMRAVADLGVPVTRLSGATRVETAVAIAEDQALTADTAILARAWPREGEAVSAMFTDAMVAGGWSASRGWPVLLTGTGAVPDATAAYMERAGVRTVHVVGGSAAVSDAAAAQLSAMGVSIARVSGGTRFDTAAAVANARAETRRFVLVDGEGGSAWAAGFAAAAYSARFDAPILPVAADRLDAAVADLLRGGGRRSLVCGPAVTSDVCGSAAREAGQVLRAEAALVTGSEGLAGAVTNLDGIAAIKVIGCGVEHTVKPDASGQFNLPVSGNSCRLTVRIEHTDGTAFDQAFTLGGGTVRAHPKAAPVPGLPRGGLGLPTGGTDDSDTDLDGDALLDTEQSTDGPADEPTAEPTSEPTAEPTAEPTSEPTAEPTAEPTEEPTAEPTEEPTSQPTEEPTSDPDPLLECSATLCGGGTRDMKMA